MIGRVPIISIGLTDWCFDTPAIALHDNRVPVRDSILFHERLVLLSGELGLVAFPDLDADGKSQTMVLFLPIVHDMVGILSGYRREKRWSFSSRGSGCYNPNRTVGRLTDSSSLDDISDRYLRETRACQRDSASVSIRFGCIFLDVPMEHRDGATSLRAHDACSGDPLRPSGDGHDEYRMISYPGCADGEQRRNDR